MFSRKWDCHTHPYTVQLTGSQIEACFYREGDREVDHMFTMWRLVRKEEAKLFRGMPEPFRVIPDFRLGVSAGTYLVSTFFFISVWLNT